MKHLIKEVERFETILLYDNMLKHKTKKIPGKNIFLFVKGEHNLVPFGSPWHVFIKKYFHDTNTIWLGIQGTITEQCIILIFIFKCDEFAVLWWREKKNRYALLSSGNRPVAWKLEICKSIQVIWKFLKNERIFFAEKVGRKKMEFQLRDNYTKLDATIIFTNEKTGILF